MKRRERPVLITGGAGFIGCNVAHRLLESGECVILYDNLSRAGVARNVGWLRDTYGERVEIVIGDVRDPDKLRPVVERASRVFHFAAQVAVTTSLVDPLNDFEINARGTLNVLEAIRTSAHQPPLLFTSTNKVYGALDDIPLAQSAGRYAPAEAAIASRGVSEARPLDFHSPYGCSKGTADQYVIDYARSYGLRAVVFRMSCIYGPHQFGTEDQGWVAHFLIRAMQNEPIVLYGDGRQVRDVLFVEDLVEAMLLAHDRIGEVCGQAFNIGGGPSNTISLLELLELMTSIHGTRPQITFEDWRTGDQRYYVSDTARFTAATGWHPTVDVVTGVTRLYEWLKQSRVAEARCHRTRRGNLVVHTAPAPMAAKLAAGEGAA